MPKLTLPRALWLAAALILGTAGAQAQDRPRVVAVNYPLQYLAQQILGDAADVEFPVPAGTDPSFWRPGIADISAIQSADLILLNGAGFAGWIDRVSLPRSRVLNTSAGLKDRFIVTETITHSHGDGGEHSHEGLANYIWLDPTLAATQAQAIATRAKRIAPEAATQIDANLAQLAATLEALDTEAQTALADAAGVEIIATHPRYQYLARRYGLSISALEWEAGVMPTDIEIAALTTRALASGARVLIWEAKPPAAAIEMASSLGLQSVVFNPMASGAPDGDFVASFRASVTALAAAARNPAN